MYKLIIFDFDGTIANTDKVIIKNYLQLYKMHAPNVKPSIDKIRTFSGPPIEETMAREFPDKTVDFMISEYRKVSKNNYIKYIKTFRNCRQTLKKLKENGYFIAIATSKKTESTRFSMELLKFNELFELVVTADDVVNKKPACDCLDKCREFYGVNREETLFVGDTNYDYKCARNSGVNVALMTFFKRPLEEGITPEFTTNSFKKLYKYIENYGK